MTILPPNVFDSGAILPSDEAVASTNPPAPDATADLSSLLAAIEEDYHLVFEARKILSVVYAPPSARPENYDKLMIDLDSLTDNEPSPIFLQR